MALTPRLELRQTQSLVMTPQLQQAIKLLQYSNMDLTDFVLQEVEKNPLLDIADTSEKRAEKRTEQKTSESADIPETPEPVNGADDYLQESMVDNNASEAPLDTNYENDYDSNGVSDDIPYADNSLSLNGSIGGGISSGGGSFDSADQSMDQRLSEEPSLRDHLDDQLNMLMADPQDKIIIQYMIGMLDEAGYLTETTDLIAERFNCPEEDVERILDIAQGMEPVGVFARNLSECLKLQQRENDRLDPAMETLLDNLDILAKRDFNTLKRICRVDAEDLKDMIEEIQALTPKPGLMFGGDVAQTVIPDVFVRKNPKGVWIVDLNSETLPKVLLNNTYHAEIKSKAVNKEDKEYLADCMANANWLVKALDQRARTILKVSTELVRQQSEFFEKGIRYLKPLNLKTIAEAIDMHESTVSRVTSNKYMATNRGIFELKYFFTTGISSTDNGDSHSAEAVKYQIKNLIDAEDPKKILSDDKLVELLKEEDIDIARRTVAKYREAMNIPSSIQRRRNKNATL